MKIREKELMQDLKHEKDRRRKAEASISIYKHRYHEQKAFQNTVKDFMNSTSTHKSGKSIAKTDTTANAHTKCSTSDEPLPSFLRALTF